MEMDWMPDQVRHDKSNAITCVVGKDDLLNSNLLFINAELFSFLKGQILSNFERVIKSYSNQ